jgi:hypothetical protein
MERAIGVSEDEASAPRVPRDDADARLELKINNFIRLLRELGDGEAVAEGIGEQIGAREGADEAIIGCIRSRWIWKIHLESIDALKEL